MMKKKIVLGGAIVVLLLLFFIVWNVWFSATRIAFVNFQIITLGEISKANDNPSVKLVDLTLDDIDDLDSYDMVFLNGMGLRITAEQRATIDAMADDGLPIMTIAATNPANNICSLFGFEADSIQQYISNGGRRNYRSMLNYIRADIDRKAYNTFEPEPLVARRNDMLYHSDPAHPEDEELGFTSVGEYEAFLKEHDLYRADAPAIVVTGVMGEPEELIAALEQTGNVVYPVHAIKTFVEKHHIDSVNVAAVINMAHGRMGDYIVDYLTEHNIPLFAPLNVNTLVEDWEADAMGMNGGFLSQSVVTPEIDGAILPYALFGHYVDDDGMRRAFAMPERLDTYVETLNKYIALRSKPNSEKRVAIYYYKGPGQGALTATGMEVVPSLYNLLKRLQTEGYNVSGLPSTAAELSELIQRQGAVFNLYAEGAFDAFMQDGDPELITKEQYEEWVAKSLRKEAYAEVVAANGPFPGNYMTTADGRLGVARLQFGNVVLMPQNAAGTGTDAFRIVHGTDAAPPHTYIASYLWMQHGFKADALIHFGTHGSLEFTPRKQVALSSNDWPDRLVGTTPHFYVYSIGDVGEAMIAKRRSYATIVSHLTPPFMESNLRETYKRLAEAVRKYNDAVYKAEGLESTSSKEAVEAALTVKRLAVEMGIHRELGIDSVLTEPLSVDEVARIEEFGEELANEKITGQLYTLGVPYEDERITSSVYAMATDPIAYSLWNLDKLRGRADAMADKHRATFTRRYLEPARRIVKSLLDNPALATDEFLYRIAHVSPEEILRAHQIEEDRSAAKDALSLMMQMAQEAPTGTASTGGASAMKASHADVSSLSEEDRKRMQEMAKNTDPRKALQMAKAMGAPREALQKMEAALMGNNAATTTPDSLQADTTAATSGMAAMMQRMMMARSYSDDDKALAQAILEVERTIKNVGEYRRLLLTSPQYELDAVVNALSGGYVAPSPGGDIIANANTLPTGRNLFAINAEETPTEEAWAKGKELAEQTIAMYRRNHNDSIPRKVSYTLWSGEFIESGGATIAQVLYMLGVEPVRDAFGRVTDLRLIASEELGRPRVDVVVQTSGQLRDIAASRLFLISRAVRMAAAAEGDVFENNVQLGVVEAERTLVEKGVSPREAREVASYRVFGGINGSYGTGIQGMVMAGDRWDDVDEIASTYIDNMNAFYGDEQQWEQVRNYAFEAALTRTDAVIQPRQSNTWGALSLDHVFEFMGGMNSAVEAVTGKTPDAYLSDYRNRNHSRMQDLKEAIGVESRSTLFNPAYIREKMKGNASAANVFAELVQNTYGWNVLRPAAIDNEMWNDIYKVYVRDEYNLGLRSFFEDKSPAALQEITAVMMESARKGLWNATERQLDDVARLHTELVSEYKPSCSGFVCDNAKLREYISQHADEARRDDYRNNIDAIRQTSSDRSGVVLQKEELQGAASQSTAVVSGTVVAVIVVVALIILMVVVKRRRRGSEE